MISEKGEISIKKRDAADTNQKIKTFILQISVKFQLLFHDWDCVQVKKKDTLNPTKHSHRKKLRSCLSNTNKPLDQNFRIKITQDIECSLIDHS